MRTFEYYHLLYMFALLNTQNMQLLFLIHKLTNLTCLSRHQTLGMQNMNQDQEARQKNKDKTMEDAVISQIVSLEQLSPSHKRSLSDMDRPTSGEDFLSILDTPVQTLCIWNSLKVYMPENFKKQFLIILPRDNSLSLNKYVVMFIPTIRKINLQQTEDIFNFEYKSRDIIRVMRELNFKQ